MRHTVNVTSQFITKFNELIVAKKKIPGTPSSDVQDDTQIGEAWIFNWQELLISLFVESWIFK